MISIVKISLALGSPILEKNTKNKNSYQILELRNFGIGIGQNCGKYFVAIRNCTSLAAKP